MNFLQKPVNTRIIDVAERNPCQSFIFKVRLILAQHGGFDKDENLNSQIVGSFQLLLGNRVRLVLRLRAEAAADDRDKNFDLVYFAIAVFFELLFASVRDGPPLVKHRVIAHLFYETFEIGSNLLEVVKC